MPLPPAARLLLTRLRLRRSGSHRQMASSSPPATMSPPPLSSSRLPTGNSLELGFYYRQPGGIQRDHRLIMEGFGAFMWFYVLYHTYHYPHMVFGHDMYPNPRLWTDEELGIPSE